MIKKIAFLHTIFERMRLSQSTTLRDGQLTYICVEVIHSKCDNKSNRGRCQKTKNNMEDKLMVQVVEGGWLELKGVIESVIPSLLLKLEK